MSRIFNNNIKNIIKDTLFEKENVNEAYVSQQKQFNIKTDFLSGKNLDNHINLYKDYIENFNKVSAKLDAVDRSNVSSNHHEYRSLKLDETYNMNAVYLHELFFANLFTKTFSR